jgi:hypothetical protein
LVSTRRCSTVVLVTLLALFTLVGAEDSTEPFVYAEFQPGGTCDDCYAWRVIVREDGTVTQDVKNVAGWRAPDKWSTRRTVQLSKRRLGRLRSTIESEGFSNLRDRYSADIDLGKGAWRVVTDTHTTILAIKLNGSIKRVIVDGPEEVAGISFPEYAHPDRAAGKRFTAIWAEILSLVRPPNSWQRARMYR